MENKLLENEQVNSDNIDSEEKIAEVAENADESLVEQEQSAESAEEVTIEEAASEEQESVVESTEEPAEESKEFDEASADKIEVAPIEEIEFVVDSKEKKRVIVDGCDRAEDKKTKRFIKNVKLQKTWNKISLVLLILVIGIPLGLLAYTIITYFLY